MKKPHPLKRIKHIKRHHVVRIAKSTFWFLSGVILGLLFLISLAFVLFQQTYHNKVYPGISAAGVNLTGQTEIQAQDYFQSQNDKVANTAFTFTVDDNTATVSARDIDLGFDAPLLAKQAFSIGRQQTFLSNWTMIIQSYFNGVSLPPSYHYDQDKLLSILKPIFDKEKVAPVEAVFTVENGKVTTFQPSSNGKEIDETSVEDQITTQLPIILAWEKPQQITIHLPVKILKPKISTSTVNNLGIQELIGTGTSLFQHSIPSRIYNVNLAASRINGTLIAPNEIFSFDKALGDVSNLTGYKQAYVIQNGHTVLGDGGGVCQVSTTFFRAALNAGLPIVERHAHDYRVGYYEEDSDPGKDATVFVPSVDLKIKNDTGHYILVQSIIDPDILRLTFNFYGTGDGRTSEVSRSIVSGQAPPPPDLFQDDPTQLKGAIKQIDFAAWGANVFFTRTVKDKTGKVIIADRFDSNYRPWQAVYLRGTQ